MSKLSSSAHIPRKRFGQNFLIDKGIINRLIAYLCPLENANFIEIGPGKGALTSALLQQGAHLHAIEVDRDLCTLLRALEAKYHNFTLHCADALRFDLNTIATSSKPVRIIGNLPYNISTPLIFHLLDFYPLIRDMHFMLQKEVVDRMVAVPNSKIYGRLSIMVQYYCDCQRLFEVPPQAFFPAPKVHSAIIRLTPRHTESSKATDSIYQALSHITRAAFNQRRKTLLNALTEFFTVADFNSLSISPRARAETLSVAEFVSLAKLFLQKRS